ncbi:MAG TPA: hypothetical protein DIT40_08935 [Alphaproteobacteria bacterium]|nr:hypothetical protein [Alphaproteobacteria bacterium]
MSELRASEIDWQHPNIRTCIAAGLLSVEARIEDVRPFARHRLTYLASVSPDLRDQWECIAIASRWQRRFAEYGLRTLSPVLIGVETRHFGWRGEPCPDPMQSDLWSEWCAPFRLAAGPVVIPPIRDRAKDPHIWREVIETLGAQRRVFLMSEDDL